MKGNNELHLCIAEMLVAVQEYLNKRMGLYAPVAKDIGYESHTFKIRLAEKEIQEMEADPCPQCIKGAVCRNPTCGRLKLPLDHPYRNNPV